MLLAPGTVIASRYRLERPLASGGMGSVWVARHLSLQTEVAIKFIATETAASAAARSRFEREARSAAHLRHPNIVAVQDYGIEDDTPYLAMELLRGESLEDRIDAKGRLSLEALAPLVQQMSRGLRKAHEAGIVHRDLKPGNVFLARDDDDDVEVIKILDFGIAKETDMSLGEATKTSELMGSPHYMSPEQLRSSKKTDVRSDLWSVGVVLYRALTGKIPFPGDTLAEVMVQVFSARLPPATSIVQDLSPGVDAFFQRALARNPDDRFQTMRELADAFQAVASGHPLPPPTITSTQEATRASLASMATATPLPVAPALSPLGGGLAQPTAALRPPHPPVAPSSSPGLSAPSSSPGLSAPSFTPPAVPVGPEPPPPLVPGGPTAPPVSMPSASRRIPPIQAAVAAVLAVGFVLAIVLVLALRRSPEPAVGVTAPHEATVQEPMGAATAAGAITPDEMAGAVPDETPIEILPDEPVPAPSATQAPRPAGWKPIPKGHGRLLIRAKGGTCKVTVNGTYYGVTPVDVVVESGRQRVFCRMPTGSTRSKELRATEFKVTKVEFEVKQ